MTLKEADNYIAFGNKIMELYHSGCRDQEKYKEVTKMIYPKIIKKEEDEIGLQLQAMMNNSRNMALQYPDNKAIRMLFGMQYIFDNLYSKVKDLGIGHMLDFDVRHKQLRIRISLCLGLDKDENESKEEYQKRNQEFLDTTPFKYEKGERSNWIYIIDNDRNKELLHNTLKTLFTYTKFQISSNDNKLREIVLFAKDINLSDEAQKIELTNDAIIYSVMKDAHDIIDSINTLRMVYTDDIALTVQHLCAGKYYGICKSLSISNDFTKEYEIVNLKEREKNMNTHQLIDEIGKTVTVTEIIETAGNIFDNLSEKMEEEYCAYIQPTIGRYGISFEMSFSSMYISSKSYKLDSFTIKNVMHEYEVDGMRIKEIKEIMKEDGIEVTSVNSSLYDEQLKITSIFAKIMDYKIIMSLYNKSPHL